MAVAGEITDQQIRARRLILAVTQLIGDGSNLPLVNEALSRLTLVSLIGLHGDIFLQAQRSASSNLRTTELLEYSHHFNPRLTCVCVTGLVLVLLL